MDIEKLHSNTTLVKVKWRLKKEMETTFFNSNTTLVKVKSSNVEFLESKKQKFKYNSC